MMEFLKTEEALAKKRIISIASSTLVEGNPGRKKKTAEQREVFKKPCESYTVLSLDNFFMACITVFTKWC